MSSNPSDFEPKSPRPEVPADSGLRGFDQDPSTKDKARDAADSVKGPAKDVKDSAKSAGRDVAGTAKQEAGAVADEAKQQGRRLLDEGVNELRTQASSIQSKLADTVDSLTEELSNMSSGQPSEGPLTDFAGDAKSWGQQASSWLRESDTDEVLRSVRRYAARNPWTFLAVAAGAGLVAGRLARGLRDSNADDTPQLPSGNRQGAIGGGYATPTQGTGYGTPVQGSGYGTPAQGTTGYGAPAQGSGYGTPAQAAGYGGTASRDTGLGDPGDADYGRVLDDDTDPVNNPTPGTVRRPGTDQPWQGNV